MAEMAEYINTLTLLNNMEEKIIGTVDGLESWSFLRRPKGYVAVFTNDHIIFLKTPGYLVPKYGIAAFLVNKTKDMIMDQQLENLTLDQILNSNYEKVIIDKSDLASIKLYAHANFLMRSKIIFSQNGKWFKFKTNRTRFNQFQKLLSDVMTNKEISAGANIGA